MIDIKILRNDPDRIRDSIQKRNITLDLDRLIALDTLRGDIQREKESLQSTRNAVSKRIPTITDANEKQHHIDEMKQVGEKIAALDTQLADTADEYILLLTSVPNFLDPTTAIGPDDSGNVVEYTSGTPKVYDFTPKTHYEIGEARKWINTEKGAEVSGSRFWYLTGDIVVLQFAILQYALSIMIQKGFTPMIPPYLVRENAMFGTGFFPAETSQIYSVNPEDDNLFLIGTSEVPLVSYHSNETIDLATPIKYVGYSSCFRREAGTYGKDMKGILRGHQFDKLEMVTFCKAEDAASLHQEMVAIEESIWQGLEIPYQKVNICSGDLGNPAMKKYDLEAWIPTQNTYREITSCSNVGTYQSRRLGIRYRNDAGELEYAHTLNGTIIAFSRCLIALLENHQNEDMTIRIPAALQPFLGGKKVL